MVGPEGKIATRVSAWFGAHFGVRHRPGQQPPSPPRKRSTSCCICNMKLVVRGAQASNFALHMQHGVGGLEVA
jgi:hypothetical protein